LLLVPAPRLLVVSQLAFDVREHAKHTMEVLHDLIPGPLGLQGDITRSPTSTIRLAARL
jgi:hypothetical protein